MDRHAPGPGRPPSGVPPGLDLAVAWVWRLAVLGGGAVLAGLALAQLPVLTGSLAAGLLLTALLQPLAARLARHGLPHAAAAWLVFLGFLAVASGVFYALGSVVATQVDRLAGDVVAGLDRLRAAVLRGPLPVRREQLERLGDRLVPDVPGLLDAAATASDLLTGLLLALFVALVLVLDGPRVWSWVVGLLPRAARERADGAGHAAWGTLVSYLKGIALVATTDATLIALGLLVLDVPLVVPLAVLTFLAALVPYVGAAVAGFTAVVVAYVEEGATTGLLVVGLVLLVQSLDGYVLEPLVVGKAVRLHPLAVVLAITLGGMLAGVAGAVVAVPLAACLNTAVLHLARANGAPAAAVPRAERSAQQ